MACNFINIHSTHDFDTNGKEILFQTAQTKIVICLVWQGKKLVSLTTTYQFYNAPSQGPTSNLSGLGNLVAGATLEKAVGMTPVGCWDTTDVGDSPLVCAPVTATVCKAVLRYGLNATADVGVAVPPMYGWGAWNLQTMSKHTTGKKR